MKFKRITATLLSLVLIAGAYSSFGISATQVQEDINSGSGVKNEYLSLSFDDNGKFEVTNLADNTVFQSSVSTDSDNLSAVAYKRTVSSELMVYYYLKSEENVSNAEDVSYSISANSEVVTEENGVRVKYDFTDCAIKVDVFYSLNNNSLSANIDLKSIEEYGNYSVSKISLLPGFGAGTNKDSGYMLVPDGSGGLINFNNSETQKYNATVYGTESSNETELQKAQFETVRMPVFGIVKNKTAVFGIIENGDAVSSITAFSGNIENNYNSVYSNVDVCYTSSKNMFADSHWNASTAYYKTNQVEGLKTYTVRYSFLTNDSADYSGMAKVYREYLINELGLKKNVQKPVLNVDIIGAIDVKKNFLGFTYYKPHALTTYNQVVEMSDAIKQEGIENLNIRYIGWNNDGISNEKVLKKLKTVNVLGGKKKFNNMNSSLSEMGVNAVYDVDFTKFYKGAKRYKVLTPFNEAIDCSRYLRSVYAKDLQKRSWFMLSPNYWSSIYEKIEKSASKLKLKNVSLSALTSNIYSDFNKDSKVTREETKNIAVEILKKASEGYSVSGEEINAYAFSYVDKIYSSPTYTSGYFILDEEVPFYQLVLHGYVDMTTPSQFMSSNREINYLKAIETGNQLLYTGIYSSTDKVTDTDYDYFYGTQYTQWLKDAGEKYAQYQPLLEKIYDSEIVSHTKIAENVFKTVYSNGVSTIVNYNENDITADGITVQGYGFCEVTQ